MRQNKKKSKSSPSQADLERAAWEALLQKELQMKNDVVPPGWIDYDKFSQKMGVCREVAALKLRQLARVGLCDRKEFRVAWGTGTRLRPYFRLKNQ